jgi:hypothetical protein
MRKMCSQWVPNDVSQQQKHARIDSCKQLLPLNDADPAEFSVRLVTDDESWFSCARNNSPCNGDITTVLQRKARPALHVQNNWHRSFGAHKESCSSTDFPRARQWTVTPTVTLWLVCAADTRSNSKGFNWINLGARSSLTLHTLQM